MKLSKKQKQKILLGALIIILIAINYSFFDDALKNAFVDHETGIVERVIDGDTVVIVNESVRLLGINSPERGERYYEEAKSFLEDEILNKTVELYFGKNKYDKYKRKLAYVFIGNKNICIESVKKGYANFYFPDGKDAYYPRFHGAWEKCINDNVNLCERSKDECAECISLEELDVSKQLVVLKNNCDFNCDLSRWTIKDEGRKKFLFEATVLSSGEEVEIGSEDFNEEYVWTKASDSLFLRDSDGGLVLWQSY